MSISAHRSQWIWTPLLGWALLSCSVSPVWAQGAAPGASAGAGTGSSSTTGAPSADVRSIIPGADAPAIDPTTGLPLVNDFNTPGSSTTGSGTGVRSSVTPTTAVQPASTLPAITPQSNSGASVAAPNVTTLTTLPATSEVMSLPSFGTTIVNAPFGASGAAPILSTGGGGGESPELGITVGSFRLFPAIEVNVGADSNVFAQSASAGPTGSLYTTIAPSLDLRSDWLNHMLHVGLSGVAAEYGSAPTQNYTNYTLVVDGRIDIQTDFFVTWSAAYTQSSEPLGTPNAVDATAPTIVNTIPLKLGVSQHIGRFFYDANVSAAHSSYISNSAPNAAALTPEAREHTDYSETFRFGYDFSEDLAFFIQPSFNQVRYTQDSTRNADGQTWSVGTTWKPSAGTSLDATVGLLSQSAADGTITSGLSYGLAGTWNGYAPLTLRPSVTRGVTQTALVNFTSALTTTYALDFNYLIHDAWTATGGLSLTTSDYSPSPAAVGVATPRTDSFYRFQIGLLYTIRPQVQIGPFFEYDTSTTTDPTNGPIYDRQIFSVRLIARR
jgi:hypothetical protein